MAELMYNIAAKKLKGTGFFAPAFLVFTLILIVCVGMLLEDYTTSYFGYSSTSSAKVWNFVVYLVAALPQLLQMAMVYIIIGFSFSEATDTERWFYGFDIVIIAIIVWAICFCLDGYWDYLHKITGYTDKGISPGKYGFYWSVVGESFLVYGLLSEVLSTVIGGLWIAMFKEGALYDTVELGLDLIEGFGELLGLIRTAGKTIVTVFLKGVRVKEETYTRKQPIYTDKKQQGKTTRTKTTPKKKTAYDPSKADKHNSTNHHSKNPRRSRP